MISVIICTRNRVELLSHSLKSLLSQDSDIQHEIIVVDNGSNDSTRQFINELVLKHSNIQYVFEDKTGLSFARNAGAKAAKYAWLAYVDDDGKVRGNFLSVTENIIKDFDFECFGGWFVPWYRSQKPKWLPDNFGFYPKWRETTGTLEDWQDIPGGIMFIKKSALEYCGGFPVNIGMRGQVVGYGEENKVQHQLRSAGKKIGFCPDLVLDHLVAEHKYELKWHLKMQYAMGKDKLVINGYLGKGSILKALLKTIAYPIPLLLLNGRKFWSSKHYYWQNWLLDSWSYPLRMFGAAYGSVLRK